MSDSDFQVLGGNSKASFTLKVHRGDGMAMLGMNWRSGKPPRDFVGFSIEFREPGTQRFWAIKNRIGFPGQRTKPSDPSIESTKAPFQKFRWVHFPRNAEQPGKFTYRVTPMFMGTDGALSSGEPQTAAIALMRETIPGKLNVAFTRGYVSSQSFAQNFAPDGLLTTLIPDQAKDGLTFKATHKRPKEAHEWMGFEARSAIHELLDEAIKDKTAEVRVIAYDLNLPEILTRLVKLGRRLRIVIDDSDKHGDPSSPETAAAVRLMKSAGESNVTRQHMGGLQHHKSIAVRGKYISKIIYGSTNFTWRGFYVQSNNAVVVTSKKATDDYFGFFESYFGSTAPEFRKSKAAVGWHTLGIPSLRAAVGLSPHGSKEGLLTEVGKDIGKAKSCVLFSLAFLGQMTKGPIGPALGKQLKSKKVHTLGIADANVQAKNFGVTVITPDNKRRVVRAAALTSNVPKPFSTEPSGLSGAHGHHRGTRMHHKFVVLDFDRADARVYLGSNNFSEAADFDNGENLVMIRDRTVATSYMIEAVRIYDHYRFRTVQSDAKGRRLKLVELRLPPKKSSDKPWWQKDWDDPFRKRDRELFA